MKRKILALGLAVLLLLLAAAVSQAQPVAVEPVAARPGPPQATADHSRFRELKREFVSGPEVTRACIACHNRAAAQVQETGHWSWKVKGDADLGKARVVNNF
ncbi:MAG: hypothetical protein JXR89_10260 [Deltaproteobacteria bacterium]|nr:hypothetical protein [Deltaproteobacteria bacterium]